MKYLTFSGINKKLLEPEIREICDFVLPKMMHQRMCNNIILHVSFEKQHAQKGTLGYILPSVFHRDPREFFMWVRASRKQHQQIETVIHELVHLKQHAKNEIHPTTLAIRAPHLKKLQFGRSTDYYNNPSEIEAYGRGRCLTDMYIDHWSDTH